MGRLGAVSAMMLALALAVAVPAPSARAELMQQPTATVPCLTCPRTVPVCWMMVYRWTDYNLRSGPGNTMLITTGAAPTTREEQQAMADLQRSLPKGMTVHNLGTSRVDCPEAVRALARRP